MLDDDDEDDEDDEEGLGSTISEIALQHYENQVYFKEEEFKS